MMKGKIVLTAMFVVVLSILPMAFAWTTSLSDPSGDLLLTTYRAGKDYEAFAPSVLQERYSYLDITGASISCDAGTCTLTMTVTGTMAPAISNPVKYVRYVWRIWDDQGNTIRIYYDWSPSSGWFAGDDAGIPIWSVTLDSNTLTFTTPQFYLPGPLDHWTARSWNSMMPDAGKCFLDMPSTANYYTVSWGCPTYLWDGPNTNIQFS